MINSISPVIINKNNNTINNNVVQVNNLIIKNYAVLSVVFTALVNTPTTGGNETYTFNIAGQTFNIQILESGLTNQQEIINVFISVYSNLFKQIDLIYNTSLVLNLANGLGLSYSLVNNNVQLSINCVANPYYDYCTKNRINNFNFARLMFKSVSNFDSVSSSPNSTLSNLTYRIAGGFPFDLSSPLLTFFNLSLNDLKNQYSKENSQPNAYAFDLMISLIWSGVLAGGSTPITQNQFNALLSTSNLSSLNDTYLKKKNYLTVNGGENLRNRYIGRYAVLETTANFVLNIGAVEIDKANFPVNNNKSTDTTFFVSDPSITYKLSAGVYNVTIRLEFTSTGTNSSPIVFFQFSTSPTIQGLQTAESNSSVNKPSTQVKNSGGDADVCYSERVLSLSVDSFMYITAYTSVGNTTFYAGQCQIIIQKIAENS